MLMHRSIVGSCIGLFFCSAALLGADASDAFRIQDQQGKHLDVLKSGQPILRYVYARDTSDKQKASDTAKPFLHVFAPDGKTTLTQGVGGKLYPHHRGIFVGWSRLEHDGKSHNLWGITQMAQVHQKFVETRVDAEQAVVASVIEWSGAGGVKVLQETRTHRLVEAGDAYVVLDVTTELKAAYGNVRLGGDPEHAGLQFRPSPQVAENKSARYTFHREGIDPKKEHDLPWVAETFQVDDSLWTVQMINHPSNPKGARWSAYRDYGRFGPFTVIEIAEGKSVVLRYRFRITRGDCPQREALQEQYTQFANVQ